MVSTATLLAKRPIALVEDDPDITALVTSLATDCALECYPDGKAAVDSLTEDGPIPELILLDLDLPTMHGLEVLKRLRMHPRTRRVPIVIFTATDLHPDEGYKLGANAWVRKPVDVDELEASIRSLLAFWAGVNRPAVNAIA